MQPVTCQRLATTPHRENRFPLDAFLGMGIYSSAKTTGFVECVQIQFSHRWVNWESICPAVGIYPSQRGGRMLSVVRFEFNLRCIPLDRRRTASSLPWRANSRLSAAWR
ncbi:hypothetical protein Pan181_17180 [Aeoliella mucimassa]|uniref:Uncharacterized protein n=1 Tax=Aeoliella mucimassa TaxID=2527972 RepID=A0A518ALF1_9BACT|nr:hypothetical protein Pan181_17180 [Aeoliella mucimassa]